MQTSFKIHHLLHTEGSVCQIFLGSNGIIIIIIIIVIIIIIIIKANVFIEIR